MNRFQFWFILFFKLFNKRFMQIHCSLRVAYILLTVTIDSAVGDGTDSMLIEVIGKAPVHCSYKILQIFFPLTSVSMGWSCVLSWLLMLCDWVDSSYNRVSAAWQDDLKIHREFLKITMTPFSQKMCIFSWYFIFLKKNHWNICRLTKMSAKSDLTITWYICNSLNFF